MAIFNKFNSFVENLAEKAFNLQSDTLKVMLTNTVPSTINTVKANLTEIAAGNGYTAGGATATVSASAQTSGTYKLVLADITFAASGGAIGPFRYFVLYDDSATNDELIGWWDYGASVSLADGESITVDFSDVNGVLQIV
jgi:hypothetical protein